MSKPPPAARRDIPVMPPPALPIAQPEQPPLKGFLDIFKLVPVERGVTSRGDPLSIARNRVIEGIREQRQAVQDQLDGKQLASTTFTTTKGESRTRGFVKWYHEQGGAVFTQVRYGQQSVFSQPDGKPMAFQAGKSLADLPAFYDGLIAAIEKGELDEQIGKLQEDKSKLLKGKTGKRPNGGT